MLAGGTGGRAQSDDWPGVATGAHRNGFAARERFLSLFREGDFVAASGNVLPWKVECDVLTADDWRVLAKTVADVIQFGAIEGVPRGGLSFAQALEPYMADEGPLLIVDDVLTTGASMERHRRGRDAIGIVAFARVKDLPPWISAVWRWGLA